jgi:hypothetical protein
VNILERPRWTVKETRAKTWGNRHVGQFIAESIIEGVKGFGEQLLEVYKQGLKGDTDFARTGKAAYLVVEHEAKRGVIAHVASLLQVRDAAIGWIEHYQSLKPKEKKSYLAEISKRRLSEG